MSKKFIKSLSGSAFIAGLLLSIIGLYLWWTQDQGTKLFQLSNDFIGAGLLVVMVAGVVLARQVINGK